MNLGTAATALHAWTTARDACTAFGIPLPGADDAAAVVEADFGPGPVRLNPSRGSSDRNRSSWTASPETLGGG